MPVAKRKDDQRLSEMGALVSMEPRKAERIIREAYERLGEMRLVAQDLGVTKQSLYHWLHRLGLELRYVLVRKRDDG
jgi:transcriptional regulator with PAS, ATPase and Fis domain